MPRWAPFVALAAASVLLLACIVPIYGRPAPAAIEVSPTATTTPRPTLSPTATESARAGVWRITEEEMNERLRSMQPQLGSGVEGRDMSVKIYRSGIVLTATLRITELAEATMPVEIRVMPVAREGKLHLDVIDVQLGGPYAAMGALVKPMLSAGLAEAFDANTLMAQQGVRVKAVELQDGYMTVTTEAES